MFLCDGHQNTFAVELLVVVTLSVKNRFILALLVTICLHYRHHPFEKLKTFPLVKKKGPAPFRIYTLITT